MKKYSHRSPRSAAVTIAAGMVGASALSMGTSAFAAPAPTAITAVGEFSVTTPENVCGATVTATGGTGASSIGGLTEAGGAGAILKFSIETTPGQVFTGAVGGAGTVPGAPGVASGGVNGGGDGGASGGDAGHYGGGGGGYTSIYKGTAGSPGADLIAIAGGGGGSGGGHSTTSGFGGDAGVATGTGAFAGSDGQPGLDGIGNPALQPTGGKGGGTSAPGAGGVHPSESTLNGFPGTGRTGGAGGEDTDPDQGGGGGGGYYGGGGGASTLGNGSTAPAADLPGGAGGGGGSSFLAAAATFESSSAGSRIEGTNGSVTFEWQDCPPPPVDLELTKTSKGFAPGATVTYTLTVKNNGAGTSTGWELVDSVPRPLSSVAATSSSEGVTCNVVGRDVSCDSTGVLEPEESATVVVTADVPAGFTGSVRNTAKVTGNEEDPTPGNNTGAVRDRVAPQEPETPDVVVDPDDDPEVGDAAADEPYVPRHPLVPAGGQAELSDSRMSWVGAGIGLIGVLGTAFAVARRRSQGA